MSKLTTAEAASARQLYTSIIGTAGGRPEAVLRWINAVDPTATHEDIEAQLAAVGYDPSRSGFSLDHAVKYCEVTKARVTSTRESDERDERLGVYSALGGSADGSGTIHVNRLHDMMNVFLLPSNGSSSTEGHAERGDGRLFTFDEFSRWVDDELARDVPGAAGVPANPKHRRHDVSPETRAVEVPYEAGASDPNLSSSLSESQRGMGKVLHHKANEVLALHRRRFAHPPSTVVKPPRKLPSPPQLLRRQLDPAIYPAALPAGALHQRNQTLGGSHQITKDAPSSPTSSPQGHTTDHTSVRTTKTTQASPRTALTASPRTAVTASPRTALTASPSTAVTPRGAQQQRFFFANQKIFTQPFRAEYRAANMAPVSHEPVPSAKEKAPLTKGVVYPFESSVEAGDMARWTA